jgi:hypothetical protein
MENKKIAAIALIISIMLSAVGFVYAHWVDQANIHGNLKMGSMTLVFDPDEILGYVDNEPPYVTPGKDVGWGEIYYDTSTHVVDAHTGLDGYKVLVCVVHDAYPQYKIDFTTVVLLNIGTVPLDITGVTIWDPTYELNWTWVNAPPHKPCDGFFWKDFDHDNVYDDPGEKIMSVKIVNFVGIQLETGENTKGEVDLEFFQPAEMCHTYHFNIEFDATQYLGP